jgi:hypothetical protein
MKDSKQGELIEEESRWVESQILPLQVTLFILKTKRTESAIPGLKKDTTGLRQFPAVETGN